MTAPTAGGIPAAIAACRAGAWPIPAGSTQPRYTSPTASAGTCPRSSAAFTATAPSFGADTMFHRNGVDAFIVMLHDQGHITAKLKAPNATAGLAIGSPILFSSVAHGSAQEVP